MPLSFVVNYSSFLSSKIAALFSFTNSRFLFNFDRSWNKLVSRVPPKKTQSLMSVCQLSGWGLGLELEPAGECAFVMS